MDRFGRHILGTAYGMLAFFMGTIASLGPVLGGVIYDRWGSYTMAWRFNLVILIVAALFMLTLKPREET